VVATPLGNLEDLTLRALRVLKEVDLIAAEDTRHSRVLLAHYGISTPLTSYYDQAERRKAPQLVAELQRGRSVALICDAGTPGIADPGYHLVRAAVDAGVRVEPIPGPSAVIAALSVGGLPTDRFVFEGFVPAKPGARRAFFAALAQEARTIVVYEAARRLEACLRDLCDTLGDRPLVIARELTKMFEEILRGPARQLAERLRERDAARALQGEVTLLIAGAAAPRAADFDLAGAIRRLRAEGMGLKEIARTIAGAHGIPQRQVYRAGLELQGETEAPPHRLPRRDKHLQDT
jgi:16S rRNA (cytidine1402-2'-O)-methyltransferase